MIHVKEGRGYYMLLDNDEVVGKSILAAYVNLNSIFDSYSFA